MLIEKEDLIDFLRDHTQKEAATHFEVSLRTIERRVRKYNLERKGANKLSMDKANEIRNLYYNEDYTQIELANVFNVSQGTINKIVNHLSYREPAMGSFKGDAIIRVNFNYGYKE
jgi:DNA-binding transcriptional regulator LsrR (DeoR family)